MDDYYILKPFALLRYSLHRCLFASAQPESSDNASDLGRVTPACGCVSCPVTDGNKAGPHAMVCLCFALIVISMHALCALQRNDKLMGADIQS